VPANPGCPGKRPLKGTRAVQPAATCHITISPYASYCHCDVILIMTSFATELAMPTVTDVRTLRTADTLPHLIYKRVVVTYLLTS